VIDAGIPSSWPAEVLKALARFKQGDLVPHPPFFYVAQPAFGIWDLTGAEGGNASEELFELAEDQRPAYGLITTQTCDLVEEGRPDHPWLQVSPVYELLDVPEDQLELLRDHRRSHLVLLDSPSLDGVWVADLRIEMPIEKSWLVGKDPTPSFRTEEQLEVLAQRLAAKKDRPALANSVMTAVVRPLANWLRGNAGRAEAAKVDELRLAVAPSRLEVDRAGLLVLTDGAPLGAADRAPWDRWWQRTQPRAADAGIDLIGNQYESYDSLSARELRASVSLNFSYLSRGM